MLDYKNPQKIENGQRVTLVLPASEVCMHMRVTDRLALAEFTGGEYHGVQLYRRDGRPFSGSITYGEAGIHYDTEHGFYFYPPANPDNHKWIGEP